MRGRKGCGVARVLSGKEVAASVEGDLDVRVARLRERGVVPALAVVRAGERPDDLYYERTVAKRASARGIVVESVVLSEDAGEDEFVAATEALNARADIHGCLLMRPLPRGVDEYRVSNALAPEKDVDGITRASLASVFAGGSEGFAPATAHACIATLDHFGIPLAGKRVAVVGRSLVVGRPVSLMLLARDATVTLCHSKTADLAGVMREADIVICATGRARAFGAECFRAGQTVIDVGINFDEDGRCCGDVDFAAVEPIVDAITPVPGGIGSATTAVMLSHVIEAAERFRIC